MRREGNSARTGLVLRVDRGQICEESAGSPQLRILGEKALAWV